MNKNEPRRTARYTEEERERIVRYFRALTKNQMAAFLRKHEIPEYYPKEEIVKTLKTALEERELSYAEVVNYVDEITQWGKQHVMLLEGPETGLDVWLTTENVGKVLAEHSQERLLNKKLPLILPRTLKLSAIEYNEKKLRLFAVERRDYWQKEEKFDKKGKTDEGDRVVYKAYVYRVDRGLVIFEWDLIANEAILQISQLPSGREYENVEEEFIGLVRPWLDITRFKKVELAPAIMALRSLEVEGRPEARSHEMKVDSPGGRSVSVKSPTTQHSVLGEIYIDEPFSSICERCAARVGNFYWLCGTGETPTKNPLEKETHTFIVADENRINFTAANREVDVRYVLQRVRSLSV